MLDKEKPAIMSAFDQLGYPEGQYGLAIIVCQKRHNTRLFYNMKGEYTNVCVGLCVGGGSIVSNQYNEFYLNSHLAVLGTSKPCKYTLIYDSIGLRVRECRNQLYLFSFLSAIYIGSFYLLCYSIYNFGYIFCPYKFSKLTLT